MADNMEKGHGCYWLGLVVVMSISNSYDVIISVDCEECSQCKDEGKTCNADSWKTTMEFDDGVGYCETQCPTCKHIRIFEVRNTPCC